MFTHLIPKSSKQEEKETPGLYTKQSFENSCAGFACSTLFCSLLENAGQAISKKMQFIFEINIYPMIWRTPGEEADETACLKFLQPFTSKEPGSYWVSDATKIAQIKPNTKEILFCKIVRDADDHHAVFACSIMENTHAAFLIIDKKVKQLDTLPPKVELVLQIPLADFRIDMIKQWYTQIESKTIEKIFEYPNVFLKTLGDIKAVCEYFPEQKNKIAEYVLTNHGKFMETLNDVYIFCDIFPEQKKDFAQLIIDNGNIFLSNATDVAQFLADFPTFQRKTAEYFMIHAEERLRQDILIISLCKGLTDQPGLKKEILEYALQSDLLSVYAKDTICCAFPEYKNQPTTFFKAEKTQNEPESKSHPPDESVAKKSNNPST